VSEGTAAINVDGVEERMNFSGKRNRSRVGENSGKGKGDYFILFLEVL
jgi:hypothetical protein